MASKQQLHAGRVANQFSESAKRYDDHAQLQYRVMEMGFMHAQKVFSDRCEILDIGCGTGFFARHAMKLQKNWIMDGLDMAPGMCAVSRDYYRRMIVADMQQMPVKSRSYDGVFSSLCVQWASNLEACFQGFYEALKPGGHAVITSFVKGTLHELSESGKAAGADDLVMPMHDQQTYNKALNNAGFDVLSSAVEPVTEYVAQLADLIQHLRAIGATNAHRQNKKKLSQQQREAMIAAYEKQFRSKEGLSVTWKPIILLARRQA